MEGWSKVRSGWEECFGRKKKRWVELGGKEKGKIKEIVACLEKPSLPEVMKWEERRIWLTKTLEERRETLEGIQWNMFLYLITEACVTAAYIEVREYALSCLRAFISP